MPVTIDKAKLIDIVKKLNKAKKKFVPLKEWLKATRNYRCVDCAEYHEGDCDLGARMAFALDCAFDAIDEVGHLPPEPDGRRWLIERGEYPAGKFPSKMEEEQP